MVKLKRRDVLYGLAGLAIPFIASSCTRSSSNSTEQPDTSTGTAQERSASTAVRIGYQRFSDLDLIRYRGELDKRLQELGATIEWTFFQSGPPMLEAMNANSLDFGGVGESPPIFAQAAGAEFYYVAFTPRGSKTQDIVVPINSSIQTPSDLQGKKIALQRGSSAHYLLMQVLKEHGVHANEVEIASLSPADARAAFEQGTVDAWSIWDPFLAVIEQTGQARNLNVGRDRRAFFLSSQSFANNHPDLLRTILEEAAANEVWGEQNSREIAEKFAAELDIPVDTLELVNQRRQWGLFPITPEVQAEQQKVADVYRELEIIPTAIEIEKAILPSEEYSKIYPS